MACYYPQLDPSKKEIRLLQLHGDAAHEDIKCTLLTISLHIHYDYKFMSWDEDFDQYTPTPERSQCTTHHPSYEALSYQWGSQNDSQPPTITVNGIFTPVTPNLHSALRHLRYSDQDRMLWVDALCINQANTAEKDSQVQRMAAIYQLADRVLVWLGDATSDSDLAISTLKQLGGDNRSFSAPPAPGVIWAGPNFNRFGGNWPYEDRHELKHVRMPDISMAAPEWLESIWAENDAVAKKLGLITTEDLSEAQWIALGHLFSRSMRPWWTRIWVVQEVAHAREVFIHCGDSTVLWDTLHDMLRQKSCMRNARFLGVMEPWVVLDTMRTIVRNPLRFWKLDPIGHSLLETTCILSHWTSTDPRDKVYALLGLASGSASRKIHPRYGSPLSDVFCEVAAAMIEESQNLDVLAQVHHQESEIVTAASWAPDWSTVQDIEPLIDINKGIRPYDTSGPWGHSTMLIRPNICGHIRGGWTSKWTAGDVADRTDPYPDKWTVSTVRWPVHQTAPPPTTRSRELHFVPQFYAKLYEARKLEVLGATWTRIQTLFEPVPVDRIATRSYRDILLEWYNTLKNLPELSSSSDSFLSEAKKLAGIHGAKRGLLSDCEFYHGYMFLSVLVVGQHRIHPKAGNEDFTAIDQRLAQRSIGCSVVRFLAWIGYLDLAGVRGLADDPVGSSLDYHLLIKSRLRGWKLAVAANQQYGLVPSGAREGDRITVLFGSCVPFVLRPVSDSGSNSHDEAIWSLVGTCYFHHIMAGKFVKTMQFWGVPPTRFLIC